MEKRIYVFLLEKWAKESDYSNPEKAAKRLLEEIKPKVLSNDGEVLVAQYVDDQIDYPVNETALILIVTPKAFFKLWKEFDAVGLKEIGDTQYPSIEEAGLPYFRYCVDRYDDSLAENFPFNFSHIIPKGEGNSIIAVDTRNAHEAAEYFSDFVSEGVMFQ